MKACEALAEEHLVGSALLAAMAKGAGVFYNYTHDMPCFDYKAGANKETDEDSGFPLTIKYNSDAIMLRPALTYSVIPRLGDTTHIYHMDSI